MLLFFIPASLIGQEQMTFYDGRPCCYYVSEMIDLEGETFVIAKDDQLSVEIFALEAGEAELIYRTHDMDKTYLLDQGRLTDQYYWVYSDRVEVFSFRDKEVNVYPMPIELPLQEFYISPNAFHFTKYGVLISPKTLQGTLQFFDFASGSIDTLSTSIDQYTYITVLDSHLYFTNSQNENAALLSHNVLTNQLTKVFTSVTQNLNMYKQGEFIYFFDNDGVYITQGTVASTKRIYQLDPDCSRFEVYGTDSSISLMCGRGNRAFYARYNSEGVLVDSISFDAGTEYISTFEYTYGNDLVYRSLGSSLFHYDRSKDSLIHLNEVGYRLFQLKCDKLHFFQDQKLLTYDLEVNELERVGDSILVDRPFSLTVERDSFFYFSFRNQQQKTEVNVFEKGKKGPEAILLFGQNSEGTQYIKPEKVGRYLLAVNEMNFPVQIFHNNEFRPIQQIQPASPLVEFNNRYFILADDKTLYELTEELQFWPIIENLPVHSSNSILFVKNGELYSRHSADLSSALHLIELNVNERTYMDILPPDTFRYTRYIPDFSSDRYILYYVYKDLGKTELWRYDTQSKNWLKLLDDAVWLSDPQSQGPLVLQDYLYFFPTTDQGIELHSVNLLNGLYQSLTNFETAAEDGNAFVVQQCDAEIIVYYYSKDSAISSIWVSEGTSEGTQQIEQADKAFAYMIPYRFENDIYFTESDSFFTHTYQYACGSGQAEVVNWHPYFITQGLYKLQGNTYSIFNHRYPWHNLSVGELYQDQITILKEAPLAIGFAGDDYYGGIKRAVPTYKLGDSILAMTAPFDLNGEELWYLYADGRMDRMTDLNEGRFDSEIHSVVAHNGYVYFSGYQYGPGRQIWRMPLYESVSTTNVKSENKPLSVFPNPSRSNCIIKDLESQEASINIYNVEGKIFQQLNKPKGLLKLEVNSDRWTKGVYFIEAVYEDSSRGSGIFIKN